jgi:hypothetical protein
VSDQLTELFNQHVETIKTTIDAEIKSAIQKHAPTGGNRVPWDSSKCGRVTDGINAVAEVKLDVVDDRDVGWVATHGISAVAEVKLVRAGSAG